MAERLLDRDINTPEEYYSDPSISRGIATFLGATNLPTNFSLREQQFSGVSEYLAVMNINISREKAGRAPARTILPRSLPSTLYWEPTTEIFMSLWQKEIQLNEILVPKRMLFILDIEYYNKFAPHHFLEDQMGTIGMLEPVYRVISEKLIDYGIPFMSVLTGKGYNFVFQITPESDTEYFDVLKIGGPISNDIRSFITHVPGDTKKIRPVPIASQQAHIGSGRLLQFLVLQSLNGMRQKITLPVTFSDSDQEGVSLDLTPNLNRTVDTGVIGIPGSLYLKPLTKPEVYNQSGVLDRTRLFSRIVRAKSGFKEWELATLIGARQSLKLASQNIEYFGGDIPVANGSLRRLIEQYFDSDLYKLHSAMDSSEGDHWTGWANSYRRYEDIAGNDGFLRQIFAPNSHLLLKPEVLSYVVNSLYDQWGGGHDMSVVPHIRTFLRSAYEDPRFNWGKRFMRNNNAAQAAEGWVTIVLGQKFAN